MYGARHDYYSIIIMVPGNSFKYTVTIEQWALLNLLLVDDKNGDTHSKIVDPLYILYENMQF
jgi:hypothetical protein